MKTKLDFVTNSSSTAYIITNHSKELKDLVDFAKENIDLLDDFLEQYDWYKQDPLYTPENLIASAAMNNINFAPGEPEECEFGDEQGTIIGQVYDYILRSGGRSANFSWSYYESRR